MKLLWVTSAACGDVFSRGWHEYVGLHRKQPEHMEGLSPDSGSTCAAERSKRTSESQPLCWGAFYKLQGKKGHSEQEVSWRTEIPHLYCQYMSKEKTSLVTKVSLRKIQVAHGYFGVRLFMLKMRTRCTCFLFKAIRWEHIYILTCPRDSSLVCHVT